MGKGDLGFESWVREIEWCFLENVKVIIEFLLREIVREFYGLVDFVVILFYFEFFGFV